MNWDKDFNEIPLSSKILGELYQGGTEEEATTYLETQSEPVKSKNTLTFRRHLP